MPLCFVSVSALIAWVEVRVPLGLSAQERRCVQEASETALAGRSAMLAAMLNIIRLWAEPPVQDLSYAARAAVHTGIWACWLLLFEYALMGQVAILKKTHLQPYTKPPRLSWLRMLAENSLGFLGWTWAVGLLAAWLNPGAEGGWQWDYSCPNLLLLGYYASACMMMYDAYSHPLHKWMHKNKTAFRLMHMKHHDTKAALDVTTSGYMALTEGVFSSALPMAALYLLGFSTGNWWYTLAGIWHCFNIVILGHCGAEISMNHWKDLLILLLNPMALWFYTCPVRHSPMDHADHHMQPRTNYAFFYTYWDDRHGTATHGKPPCTLLVLTAHAVWQLLVLSTAYALVTRPATTLAAYTTCYLLVPVAAAAAVSEQLRLPQITRALFGRVMDQYRSDNYITYADAGTAGAFAAGAGAATAATPSAEITAATAPDSVEDRDVVKGVSDSVSVRAKDQDQKEPVYLFACHPAGLLSRAAFCNFAARGWRSPVSALRDVRLAVGNVLFSVPIPFLREFLLACGCIPASKDSMHAALRSGCSVAVTLGGWREGRYHSSYKLVLKRRKGFIQLAQETGAVLVPVLCLGEQDVAVLPDGCAHVPFLLWGYRFLQFFRPHPVKVMFGQGITPQHGESTEKLHSRYVHALFELGRQHNVQLELAE